MLNTNSEKIYCYVDETGLDLKGGLFIVSVVIVPASEKEALTTMCENAERISEKGKRKWTVSSIKRRRKYMQEIDRWPFTQACCYFGLFQFSRKYEELTIKTIISAVKAHEEKFEYSKATIIVDGLETERVENEVRELRRNGLRVKKLRGVNDQSYCEIRLADAMCGRVRAAWLGDEEFKQRIEIAVRKGRLVKLY